MSFSDLIHNINKQHKGIKKMFEFKGDIQELVNNELFLLSEGKDGNYITLSKFLKEVSAVAKDTNDGISHTDAKKLVAKTLIKYVSGEALIGEWVELGSWYLEVDEMVYVVDEAVQDGIEDSYLDANLSYYGE